jgi:hypothetical protein
MAKQSDNLSIKEFASLLAVGNAHVHGPTPTIPAERSARLHGPC